MDGLVVGIGAVVVLALAGIAFLVWDHRTAGRPPHRRRDDGVDRLPTTGPDSGGQRQGGHVNPYMPPIRQDGINNPAGF